MRKVDAEGIKVCSTTPNYQAISSPGNPSKPCLSLLFSSVEYVQQFQNKKFTFRKPTNIHNNLVSSSEDEIVINLAFK